MPKQGLCIVLEGCDGLGKSTQITHLAETLRGRGFDVVVTREPGGTTQAETIRDVLLAPSTEALTPWAELCLFFAARSQHIENLIGPALAAGKIVLCDRFTSSTRAYQSAAQNVPDADVLDFERIVQKGFRPDMTLVLDGDLSLSRKQRMGRGAGDHFDEQNDDFFRAVRQSYLHQAEERPNQFRIISADGSENEIHDRLMRQVEALLNS